MNNTMTLNVYPDSDTLSTAFADILTDYDWQTTHYTVIYENKDNLIKLKDVLQNHEPNSKPVVVRQLTEDYSLILKDIKNFTTTRIILDISTEKIVPFLKAADELKMLSEYYSYFITNLDTHTLDISGIKNATSSMSNITSLRLVIPGSDEIANTLRVWNHRDSKLEMNEDQVPLEAALVHDAVQIYFNALNIHSAGNKKPVTPRQKCGDERRSSKHFGFELAKFMKKQDFEGITGHVEFNEIPPSKGTRTEFSLEILEIISGIKIIGTWDKTKKIEYLRDLKTTEAETLQKIQDKDFKIVVKLGEPFLMEVVVKDGEPYPEGNNRYRGYVVDLIKRIQHELKFSFILEVVPDGNYGSLDSNGKWDGLVRYLLDGKADLAVADISITYERKTAVDFTVPFMNLGISILYKHDEPKPTDLYSFRKPFDMFVWLYTSLAFITISILVFILSRINVKDWEPSHPCNQDPEEVESIWNIMNCIWLSMGSIMGQGCDILPK